METYLYNCHYCNKDYKPRRRKKQKYCSNSCRTLAFNLKKKSQLSFPINTNKNNKTSIDNMSVAGIGNAAVGTFAANTITNWLTRDENKPATKKDIKDIKELVLKRYHEILNMQTDLYGNYPYYDIELRTVVYLKN